MTITPIRPHLLSLIALLLILSLAASSLPFSQPATAQEGETIPLYGRFELNFELEGEVANPYDPESADVMATFTAPSGRRLRVPGFFMVPYEQTCTEDCQAEVLEAAGPGEWHVRFTPDETGRWQYNIVASLNEGEAQRVARGSFQVTDADAPGFIRTADNNRYFVFDDGTPYFPIGQNLAWSWEGAGGVFGYITWLDELQAAGANYARLLIDVPWFIGLEWAAPAGQYGGSGQEAAWRLDTLLEEARQRGIYLQLVLIWHRAFQDYGGPPVVIPEEPPRAPQNVDFSRHPYNAQLNGSLASPGGVFRDPVSIRLLERRLRYIAARWGYSPQIFAWEVVDKLDEMASFGAERDIAWLNQLIAMLREHDPFDHLVTVGLGSYNALIQTQADIDFTQAQLYQTRPIEASGDQVALTFAAVTQARAAEERPALLSEFSLNRWFEPINDDESGVHIQNTLWASVLSGAAGGGMTWWWDTYIAPQELYHLYTPLRLFTQDIPWPTADFQVIEPGLIAGRDSIDYQPLRLDGFNRQFRSPTVPDTLYRVTADGAAPPLSITSSYLYGQQFNAANSRPQTFIIAPPVDTQLIIRVENVSPAADAQLVVQIDGQVRTTLDLPAGTRGLTLNFPLSAGQHTVVLDNLGQDWLQLAYLEIEDYRAPLRALALADIEQGLALVWLHHRQYTWDTVQAGEAIDALDYDLRLPQMPPGMYLVEFWDPLTGQVIGEERLTASAEQPLTIDLLPIDDQLALRIFRLDDGPPPAAPTLSPTRTPAPDG